MAHNRAARRLSDAAELDADKWGTLPLYLMDGDTAGMSQFFSSRSPEEQMECLATPFPALQHREPFRWALETCASSSVASALITARANPCKFLSPKGPESPLEICFRLGSVSLVRALVDSTQNSSEIRRDMIFQLENSVFSSAIELCPPSSLATIMRELLRTGANPLNSARSSGVGSVLHDLASRGLSDCIDLFRTSLPGERMHSALTSVGDAGDFRSFPLALAAEKLHTGSVRALLAAHTATLQCATETRPDAPEAERAIVVTCCSAVRAALLAEVDTPAQESRLHDTLRLLRDALSTHGQALPSPTGFGESPDFWRVLEQFAGDAAWFHALSVAGRDDMGLYRHRHPMPLDNAGPLTIAVLRGKVRTIRALARVGIPLVFLSPYTRGPEPILLSCLRWVLTLISTPLSHESPGVNIGCTRVLESAADTAAIADAIGDLAAITAVAAARQQRHQQMLQDKRREWLEKKTESGKKDHEQWVRGMRLCERCMAIVLFDPDADAASPSMPPVELGDDSERECGCVDAYAVCQRIDLDAEEAAAVVGTDAATAAAATAITSTLAPRYTVPVKRASSPLALVGPNVLTSSPTVQQSPRQGATPATESDIFPKQQLTVTFVPLPHLLVDQPQPDMQRIFRGDRAPPQADSVAPRTPTSLPPHSRAHSLSSPANSCTPRFGHSFGRGHSRNPSSSTLVGLAPQDPFPEPIGRALMMGSGKIVSKASTCGGENLCGNFCSECDGEDNDGCSDDQGGVIGRVMRHGVRLVMSVSHQIYRGVHSHGVITAEQGAREMLPLALDGAFPVVRPYGKKLPPLCSPPLATVLLSPWAYPSDAVLSSACQDDVDNWVPPPPVPPSRLLRSERSVALVAELASRGFSLLGGVTVGSCLDAERAATVDKFATVGEHVELGARASLSHHVTVGRFAAVGRKTSLSHHVTVGNCATVGQHVTVGSTSRLEASAIVGSHAVLGSNVTVGKGSTVGSHTVLGNHVTVGKGVTVGCHATVGNHVKLGDGVTVGCYATVNDHAVLREGTTVGLHTTVCNHAKLGEKVVVGCHAAIEANVTVGDRAIVGCRAIVKELATVSRGVTVGHFATVDEFASVKEDTLAGEGARVIEAPTAAAKLKYPGKVTVVHTLARTFPFIEANPVPQALSIKGKNVDTGSKHSTWETAAMLALTSYFAAASAADAAHANREEMRCSASSDAKGAVVRRLMGPRVRDALAPAAWCPCPCQKNGPTPCEAADSDSDATSDSDSDTDPECLHGAPPAASPLLAAVARGMLSLARVLVEAGADTLDPDANALGPFCRSTSLSLLSAAAAAVPHYSPFPLSHLKTNVGCWLKTVCCGDFPPEKDTDVLHISAILPHKQDARPHLRQPARLPRLREPDWDNALEVHAATEDSGGLGSRAKSTATSLRQRSSPDGKPPFRANSTRLEAINAGTSIGVGTNKAVATVATIAVMWVLAVQAQQARLQAGQRVQARTLLVHDGDNAAHDGGDDGDDDGGACDITDPARAAAVAAAGTLSVASSTPRRIFLPCPESALSRAALRGDSLAMEALVAAGARVGLNYASCVPSMRRRYPHWPKVTFIPNGVVAKSALACAAASLARFPFPTGICPYNTSKVQISTGPVAGSARCVKLALAAADDLTLGQRREWVGPPLQLVRVFAARGFSRCDFLLQWQFGPLALAVGLGHASLFPRNAFASIRTDGPTGAARLLAHEALSVNDLSLAEDPSVGTGVAALWPAKGETPFDDVLLELQRQRKGHETPLLTPSMAVADSSPYAAALLAQARFLCRVSTLSGYPLQRLQSSHFCNEDEPGREWRASGPAAKFKAHSEALCAMVAAGGDVTTAATFVLPAVELPAAVRVELPAAVRFFLPEVFSEESDSEESDSEESDSEEPGSEEPGSEESGSEESGSEEPDSEESGSENPDSESDHVASACGVTVGKITLLHALVLAGAPEECEDSPLGRRNSILGSDETGYDAFSLDKAKMDASTDIHAKALRSLVVGADPLLAAVMLRQVLELARVTLAL